MDAAALAMEARNRYGTWRAAAEATGVDHATLWRTAHGVGEPEAINVRRLTPALKGETMQDNYGYQVVEGRDAVIDAMIAENARLTGELAECRAALAAAEARAERAEAALKKWAHDFAMVQTENDLDRVALAFMAEVAALRGGEAQP